MRDYYDHYHSRQTRLIQLLSDKLYLKVMLFSV